MEARGGKGCGAVRMRWPAAVSRRLAGPAVGHPLLAGESFGRIQGGPGPDVLLRGGLGNCRGPALVPTVNRSLTGARGCFLGSPVSPTLGAHRSLAVGLGWSLLFAQGGEARVAPQGLTERGGQEGKCQRSGRARQMSG